ncbi:DUF551 domain-containing protein [Klebsiella pasteurii]|uniref:DUF551 domain-containing protein n=1 Tax=Klebsiella pasteurii TaxID=2587529 RepID=UPI0035CF7F58
MTKPTIARERLEWLSQLSGRDDIEDVDGGEIRELARMALASMDSEPVAVTDDMAYAFHHALTDGPLGNGDVEEIKAGLRAAFANVSASQPVPQVSEQPAPVVPEVLPCPVLLEPGLRFGKGIKTRTVLAALARREVYESDMAALSPEEKAEFWSKITDLKALLSKQTSVSPDFDTWFNGPDAGLRVVNYHIQRELQESAWNACHAAMLQAGNSPVIPDGYVLVPKEPTEEMINAWLSEVANWRGHISGYKAMLAAVDCSIPMISDRWIPVSERMPEDEQEVLTTNRMGHRFVSFFDKHSGLFFDRIDAPAACCIEHVLVTHWMPLPAAPQEVNHG